MKNLFSYSLWLQSDIKYYVALNQVSTAAVTLKGDHAKKL